MSGMKRGGWAADEFALQQKSRSGVIRRSVLMGMGVAAKTIVDRTVGGGPWQRILPGLVLLHNGQPSRQQRNTAAVMYGGDDAMLSGRAGLALHGFGTSAQPSKSLLLIPQGKHRKDISFVEVERTWRPPEPVKKVGLPVAPLNRCLLDAARRMTDQRACTALIAEVVQRGAVDVGSLLTELDKGSGRGSALPRRALRELLGGAHSVAEVDAAQLYARSGLPPGMNNVAIYTEAGEFIMIADNWIDDVAVSLETDSFEHHASPQAYEQTASRRVSAEGHGVIVVSHSPNAIRTQPDKVMDDWRKAYQRALERPRPNVVAIPRDASHRAAS